MEPSTSASVNSEEESFIILSSSEPSLRYEVIQNRSSQSSLEVDLKRAISQSPQSKTDVKGITPEESSSFSFKAHFKTEKQPTEESLVIAKSMLNTCNDMSDMQTKIGELLDENIVLRDMLKQNNASMREQFQTISGWHADIMKTNQLHKTKFAETKELIETLRGDNVKLRSELDCMKVEKSSIQSATADISEETRPKSAASGTGCHSFECINRDNESTIDMLTAQLEIVERQRRQVITSNEELLSQKESLENVLKQTKQENNQLKMSLSEALEENNKEMVDPLIIKTLESKITSLQSELKNSQVKLFESENMKLQHTQHKQNTQENIKLLNANITELKGRLREAHTLTFQPIRYSLSLEAQCDSSEFSNFVENVKLYDKILKDLATHMNQHSQEFCSLYEIVSDLSNQYSPQSKKTDQNAQQMKADLAGLKAHVDKHLSVTASHGNQVKTCLSALEKMFLDYQQVLKILKSEELDKSMMENMQIILDQQKINIDGLMAQLVEKDEKLNQVHREIGDLRKIIENFQQESDERDLLRAQIEVYKIDFEAERDARTQLASEKQEAISNLNSLHKRNQLLVEEMDRYRSQNPHQFSNGSKRSPNFNARPSTSQTAPSLLPIGNHHSQNAHIFSNGLKMSRNQASSLPVKSESPEPVQYNCPICDDTFKSVKTLEEHVESCLQQVFTCPNCSFSTRDYSLMNGHLYSCLDSILP